MKWVNFALGFAFSAGLAGCATPTMKVPADVLSMEADQLVVTERKRASGAFVNESFKLGSYGITDVDRDWNTAKGYSVPGFSDTDTTSGYSFKFGASGGAMAGQCLIEGNTKATKIMGGITMSQSVSKMGCACEGGGIKAEAVLNNVNSGQYSGTVKTSGGEYTIEAIYKAEGAFSTGNPTGYRVDSDVIQAAADVMYPGKVWLGKSLSDADKDQLSCLFAGLMLYTGERDID